MQQVFILLLGYSCHKIIKSLSNIRIVLIILYNMSFVCKQCNANFTKKYNLSRHQSTHHQKNKDVDNKFVSI